MSYTLEAVCCTRCQKPIKPWKRDQFVVKNTGPICWSCFQIKEERPQVERITFGSDEFNQYQEQTPEQLAKRSAEFSRLRDQMENK